MNQTMINVAILWHLSRPESQNWDIDSLAKQTANPWNHKTEEIHRNIELPVVTRHLCTNNTHSINHNSILYCSKYILSIYMS